MDGRVGRTMTGVIIPCERGRRQEYAKAEGSGGEINPVARGSPLRANA